MEPDGELEIRENVSWEAFEAYLAEKAEAVVPRVTYLDGVLELVTPSRGHEIAHRWMSWLLGVYAEVAEIELSPFGAWLLKDKAARAEAEPDDCYIIGPYEDRERPDLVVEVQWSRRKLSKLEVYRRLQVPEVWIWPHPTARTMEIYAWSRGEWRKRERSKALPDLDVAFMCTFLDRTTASAAARDYRAALRKRRK